MKKILLVCNTSNSIMTFRKKWIEKLLSEGHNVHIVAFDEIHREAIEKLAVTFHYLADKNRSVNPFKILSLKNRYCKLIKQINPDVVFTFMLKPNVFGVRAAKKAGIKNIFSMVEGAGDVFIYNSLKWKIIRFVACNLYRRSFKYSKKVFFLNEDDKVEFIERKLVKAEQCELVHGVGVDLTKFIYSPIENKNRFLMVARMLKTKGVFEYCEAARIVKEKFPEAEFHYVGPEGTVAVADIKEYIDDGSIVYHGAQKDVADYYKACAVNVLPSYREGFSVTIMEAEAIGRAIITTKTNGCKEAVKEGYNGFLVNVGNAEQIAERMIWFLEHPKEMEEMGKNARLYAEEHFDCEKINEKIYSILKKTSV